MTRAQALSLAQAKWGDAAYVRYDRRAAMRAKYRALAQEELKEHRARKPRPPSSLPSDDPFLPQARERFRTWWKREEDLMLTALSYGYAVGYVMLDGFAFHIQGVGDSWEEACRKANLL